MTQYQCEICESDPATNHVSERVSGKVWYTCDGCAPAEPDRFTVTELEPEDFVALRPNFVGMGRNEDPDAYDRQRDNRLTS